MQRGLRGPFLHGHLLCFEECMDQKSKNIIFRVVSLKMRLWKSWVVVMFKYILMVSLLFSASPQIAFAEALRCESIFSESHLGFDEPMPFSDQRFAKAYKDEYEALEKWWQRRAVQLTKAQVKSKVEIACRNGCSEKDISRIVSDSVENTFVKFDKAFYQMKRARGFAILTGITVGTIIGGSYIKIHLPGNERFLSDVVSTVTTIAIYKLGAPLLDQVTSLAVRGGYRLQHGKEFFRKNMEFARMRALYNVLREKMTPLEQEEAGRMTNLLGQLAPTFGTAIESMESGDRSKGGMPAAAARIADIAIRMRQYFPEIKSNDPEVVRTIDMVFTQRVVVEDPNNAGNFISDTKKLQLLYDLTIKQIEKYDPLYKESPEVAELYRDGIASWLGLK